MSGTEGSVTPAIGREDRTAMAALSAHAAVLNAKTNRSRAIRAALDAGHSTRSLASLLGVGHMTIHRWANA